MARIWVRHLALVSFLSILTIYRCDLRFIPFLFNALAYLDLKLSVSAVSSTYFSYLQLAHLRTFLDYLHEILNREEVGVVHW